MNLYKIAYVISGAWSLIGKTFDIDQKFKFESCLRRILKKIDQLVIYLFRFIKLNFIKINFSVFSTNEYFSMIFNNLLTVKEKLFHFLNSKYPDLSKLINDLHPVYVSNKKFILYLLRAYMYLYVFFYISVFLSLFLATCFDIKLTNDVAIFFIKLFSLWSFPFRKLKFILIYILTIFTKIIESVFNIIIFILKKIFNKKSSECSQREQIDEQFKNFKSQKGFGEYWIDPTQHQLDCTTNGIKKIINRRNTISHFKSIAHRTSFELDNGVEPKTILANFKNNVS